jgi:hypothetical protein
MYQAQLLSLRLVVCLIPLLPTANLTAHKDDKGDEETIASEGTREMILRAVLTVLKFEGIGRLGGGAKE